MSMPELRRVLRRTDFFGGVGRAYGSEWMFRVARRSERRTALITYEELRSSPPSMVVARWIPRRGAGQRGRTRLSLGPVRVDFKFERRRGSKRAMPTKTVETPYPLIDADPHASRVIRYFRASDYATWAAATAAFPSALYLWGTVVLSASQQSFLTSPAEMADRSNARLRTSLRLGGLLGFVGGFLLAYQRSSCAFTVVYVVVVLTSWSNSPFLGLVGKQAGGRLGFGRAHSTGEGGQASLRRIKPARVGTGRGLPELSVFSTQILCVSVSWTIHTQI